MSFRTTIATFTILISTLAACGSEGSGTSVVSSGSATVTTPATDSAPTNSTPSSDVPVELSDIGWLLESHLTIGGLQPYQSGTGAGITFNADSTLDVDTGCNMGTAPVTFEGEHTVLIGPLTMTEKACTDTRITEIEMGLLFVLAEPLTWSVSGGVMTLIPQNITDTGLHFVLV